MSTTIKKSIWTSVDTLVYQLEDDKPTVRWDSLQKLRRIAAVETTHFPVRNARRFLQCVRRRIIGETDRRVAIEALRLIGDVMVSLEDNIDQVFSSILPHLISLLPNARKIQEDVEVDTDWFHEEIVQVFRKYTIVSNDLRAVAELLVNIGLGSGQGSIREASLVVLMRLLDERFLKRSMNRKDCDRSTIGRGDKALIVALVQAIIPALEDVNEKVVVAAEEAIAKLESYWGSRFSVDVMKYISTVDKQMLQVHQKSINEFLLVCTNSTSPLIIPSQPTSNASVTVGRLLRPSPSLKSLTGIHLGFLIASIVTTLTSYTSNSSAKWGQRTAAVEQLYAACKDVDVGTLCGFSSEERVKRMDELEPLFDILVKLTKDVDLHLVKRALQITQTLFRKLIYSRQSGKKGAQHDKNEELDGCHTNHRDAAFYMTQMLSPIVETAANFARDDYEMESFVYALLGQIFESAIMSVSMVEQVLASALLRRRRSQVREEAVKAWLVLRLIAKRDSQIFANDAPNGYVVQTLGCLLGDTNARVRDLAFEVVAVLTLVCRCNIYAILETCIDDDYVSERVDWAALRARLWRKRVPELRSNNTLQIEPATTSASRSLMNRIASNVEQSLDNVSELRMMIMQEEPKFFDSYHQGIRTIESPKFMNDVVMTGEPFDQEKTDRTSSSPTTVGINDKLSALRKKISQLHQPHSKRLRHPDQEARTEVNSARLYTSKLETMQHPRSKSSPEQSAYNLDGDVDHPSKGKIVSPPSTDKRVHPSNFALTSPTLGADKFLFLQPQPTHSSPQHLQSFKSEVLINEDHLHKSNQSQSPCERPIRPMNTSGVPDIYISGNQKTGLEPRKNRERTVSLATRKRLEAKSKQDCLTSLDPFHRSNSYGTVIVDQSPRPFYKQEPRYLEPHEIASLTNPKQELIEALFHLQDDNWEINFDALSMVRRLALHHSNIIDASKIHALIAEIMKQVMNLRSSVSKNALLALESMCVAFSREIDLELEKIVPLLLKRCADSNAFVSESAVATFNTMVLKCSTARVVASLQCSMKSKAVPIRREVARVLYALIVNQAETIPTNKDLPLLLQLVGQCLLDSHNEVRDVAKQTVLHLHYHARMSDEQIKRLLPVLAQSKVDSVLQGKVGDSPPVPKVSTLSDIVTDLPISSYATKKQVLAAPPARITRIPKQVLSGVSPPALGNETRIKKISSDELVRLESKLGSSNWKDRFDALEETTNFICSCASALVESGLMLTLFDQLIKRLDDGNAKVNVLALKCMEQIAPAVGTGMEQVLPNIVPAITKNLANARMSSLAQSVMQKLCAHADHRSLCQLLVTQARNANSRVLPVLLDILTQLTTQSVDEKSNFVLTHYVLPLALTLLKEAKRSIKDANSRLLRQLQRTLGPAVVSRAASKLDPGQLDKLSAMLR